jgi:hypothetical protein
VKLASFGQLRWRDNWRTVEKISPGTLIHFSDADDRWLQQRDLLPVARWPLNHEFRVGLLQGTTWRLPLPDAVTSSKERACRQGLRMRRHSQRMTAMSIRTSFHRVRFCSLAGGSGADEVSMGRNGRGLRQFLPRNGANGAIKNLYQGCRALPSSLYVRQWKTIW